MRRSWSQQTTQSWCTVFSAHKWLTACRVPRPVGSQSRLTTLDAINIYILLGMHLASVFVLYTLIQDVLLFQTRSRPVKGSDRWGVLLYGRRNKNNSRFLWESSLLVTDRSGRNNRDVAAQRRCYTIQVYIQVLPQKNILCFGTSIARRLRNAEQLNSWTFCTWMVSIYSYTGL